RTSASACWDPHEIGMHRVAFRVDDLDAALAAAARHGCHPLRGVATYEDVYRLTYLRGPSGILVMLAEELRPSAWAGPFRAWAVSWQRPRAGRCRAWSASSSPASRPQRRGPRAARSAVA